MYNEKPVTICITVLNNYNGLREEIESIEKGSVKPDRYCIFDNGRKLNPAEFAGRNINLVTPNQQKSLAASWNWFSRNVPEIRIAINDDIIFFEDTLEVFLKGMGDDTFYFPYGLDRINSYSFFNIPDKIYNLIGGFDEEFYPAYFEDNSADYKLHLAGLWVHGVYDCNLIHKGSQTLKNYTKDELSKHHINFQRCSDTYVKMWGGKPGHETYKTKFNR